MSSSSDGDNDNDRNEHDAVDRAYGMFSVCAYGCVLSLFQLTLILFYFMPTGSRDDVHDDLESDSNGGGNDRNGMWNGVDDRELVGACRQNGMNC